MSSYIKARQSSDSSHQGFWADFSLSLPLLPLAFELALEDVRDRYRRSFFGIFWIAITFFAFIGVKNVVFSQLGFAENENYLIFLSVGFGFWLYINSVVTESATILVNSRTWILSSNLPYFVYYWMSAIRNLITFILTLVSVFALLLFAGVEDWGGVLWFVPGIAVYFLASLWSGALLGVICLRFRDINHLISTGMRLAFFATPILWVPADNPVLGAIANWNPFTHFLAIVRDPIMGNGIPMDSWAIVGAISLAGIGLAVVVVQASYRRVAFWV